MLRRSQTASWRIDTRLPRSSVPPASGRSELLVMQSHPRVDSDTRRVVASGSVEEAWVNTSNPCKETVMRATLYAWKGSPSEGRKEPFGEVRIDASSGRAVWDPSLDPY